MAVSAAAKREIVVVRLSSSEAMAVPRRPRQWPRAFVNIEAKRELENDSFVRSRDVWLELGRIRGDGDFKITDVVVDRHVSWRGGHVRFEAGITGDSSRGTGLLARDGFCPGSRETREIKGRRWVALGRLHGICSRFCLQLDR